MNKRPEKETDPDKLPGQIINPIPESLLYKPTHGGYPDVKHDWRIWPETDGLVQRCSITGEYRDTPEEDKFWKYGGK